MALGGLAGLLLMGDARIKEHFLTIFQTKQEAMQDAESRMAYESAQSRTIFWRAGLNMLHDHPLGSGGNAFKGGGCRPYLAEFSIGRDRALHEGFLTEATNWGLQGLALRLAFLASSAMCAYKTLRFQFKMGDSQIAFFGSCILASMVGFMITALFGDFVHLEWSYWIAALAVVYANVYGPDGIAEDTGADYGTCEGPASLVAEEYHAARSNL